MPTLTPDAYEFRATGVAARLALRAAHAQWPELIPSPDPSWIRKLSGPAELEEARRWSPELRRVWHGSLLASGAWVPATLLEASAFRGDDVRALEILSTPELGVNLRFATRSPNCVFLRAVGHLHGSVRISVPRYSQELNSTQREIVRGTKLRVFTELDESCRCTEVWPTCALTGLHSESRPPA